MTEQNQGDGEDQDNKRNAVTSITVSAAAEAARTAAAKKKREAEGPREVKPGRKHRTLEVKGIPASTYLQFEMLARRSNLTVGQLGLLAVEHLLTAGPDGKPVVLPKWSKVLDR